MLRQDLASNNAIKFDVSTFSDGLYFVKVQLDGEHFTERLFVAEKN
ncbi:MAG: T9SS type A sorting domain-containing protein [Saprospiraceae bacterium]|nr:T9SS type A sorting domain-containing protein [Saprospiraceae bacterium]